MIEELINVDYIINKFLDIKYANISEAQKLDIYLPEKGQETFPVILSIHGGAFKMGDKRDSQVLPMLEGLQRGYAVVSINYRLSGEAIFPAQINDVKAAIRFIKANSQKYNLNKDKIVVWGGSAGGHLSAMAGLTAEIKELEDLSLGNEKEDSKVIAVVDWFGPTDFSKMDEAFIKSGLGKADHNDEESPESILVGGAVQDNLGKVQFANPITYVTKEAPPFLIQHGSIDNHVPTEQSILLKDALLKVGAEVEFEVIEGAKHGGPLFKTEQNIEKVFEFIDKYVK